MFYSFEGTDRTHHLCGSLLFHVPDTGMERVLNPPVGLFVAHMLTLCPVALLTLLVLEAFFFFFGRFFRIFYGDDRVVPQQSQLLFVFCFSLFNLCAFCSLLLPDALARRSSK